MTKEELHRTITQLLEQEVAANPVSYNTETPYQSYERIGFQGLRWSVEKRIREYDLEVYFNPESKILDIGSNFGFFVCEFALHCAQAHGVEPNHFLNSIGEATADYLGVRDKVEFFDCLFDDFEAPVAYDVVFSLAAFFTADGRERSDAEKYFGQIEAMLAPGGCVFYESTSYTKDPESSAYEHFVAAESAVAALQSLFPSVETWETTSGSAGFFRRFAKSKKS